MPLALRALFALAGLMALVPAGAFPAALYTDIAGAAIGGFMIVREILMGRGYFPARQTEAKTPGE
jgi:hypothetical protein